MADYEDNKIITKPFTLFNNETGQSIEIPILSGTEGPNVLDIRSLYKYTRRSATTRIMSQISKNPPRIGHGIAGRKRR